MPRKKKMKITDTVNAAADADFYTPEADINSVGLDGRVTLLAPAGVPIPMHIAIARGYAGTKKEPVKTETKAGE